MGLKVVLFDHINIIIIFGVFAIPRKKGPSCNRAGPGAQGVGRG